MFEENSYKENVELFENILSEEADKLLCNENLAIVYIGRETCPYCRKFAKKLSDLVNEINTIIYYIDSSNSSDNYINSFREKYNIVTVPGFIIGKNGDIQVRCDSSTPEEEILEMIQ